MASSSPPPSPGRRRRHTPGRPGSWAAALTIATAALAGFGALAVRLGAAVGPLLAHAALFVAVGGAILSGTVAAIGLTATRGSRDRQERHRAGFAAIASAALLIALVVALGHGLGRVVVPG